MAYEEVDTIKQTLQAIRNATVKEFETVHEAMKSMATVAGHDLSVPRVCGRQTMRSNIPAETNEDYWRQ